MRTDIDVLMERYPIPDELLTCVRSTFDPRSKELPSGELIRRYTSDSFVFGKSPGVDHFMLPMVLRELYLEKAFVVYNYELLKALKEFCELNSISSVSEILCGTGWFSHWMKKYGIPVKHTVDNKSWVKYKRKDAFLPIVKKMDAVKHVKLCRKVQMFVMSWPYMDPIAANVWKAMKPGTLLLYIGEDMGGCTADDEFFNLTEGHEISDETDGFMKVRDSYIRFWGLHDEPRLFRK